MVQPHVLWLWLPQEQLLRRLGSQYTSWACHPASPLSPSPSLRCPRPTCCSTKLGDVMVLKFDNARGNFQATDSSAEWKLSCENSSNSNCWPGNRFPWQFPPCEAARLFAGLSLGPGIWVSALVAPSQCHSLGVYSVNWCLCGGKWSLAYNQQRDDYWFPEYAKQFLNPP